MRRLTIALLALWLVAISAAATPDHPVNGAEYTTLTTPQPVSAVGNKVEVIEFFMYHCPACNSLEPQLLAWVKKQGSNIEFRRIHLPLHGANDPEAHLFLTLESLRLEQSLHAKILNSWHVEHHQLLSDEDNIDWAIKNGIDKNKFIDAYYSFSVNTRLQNLQRIAESYLVNSTPSLVIDGRFITGPGLIQDSNKALPATQLDSAMLEVADALVLKARAGR